jgi:hypothetical protein
MKDLEIHESSCDPNTSFSPPQSLLQLTLGEMLTAPLHEPLSPDEERVCTRLVKRATAGGEQLVLKTGGQVSCLLESDGGGKKSETVSEHTIHVHVHPVTDNKNARVHWSYAHVHVHSIEPNIPTYSHSSSVFI